ncbi:four helix bundle protein [Candidatus Peregrinibacteria bacterium CG10_big_fil_rev_8_21_14_0_10_49_10]|nr:MAG: four helix bundle protein [Candidatus Peregrinibacteria bacterium CG10_big_fil_rev_8_21_14_0_10_49_10]
MSNANPLKEKSYAFSLDIIELCKQLKSNHEYEIGSQLLKSGTSVGANIEESNQAQSKKDFVSKLSISLKEAYESHYWIRLLRDSQIVPGSTAASLLEKNEELMKLLTSVIKATKVTMQKVQQAQSVSNHA